MTHFTKTLVGTLAIGAMAVTSASPAYAQDRGREYRQKDRKIDGGDILAGALILGGIVAVASSSKNKNRYNYRDRDYRNYGDRYNNRRNSNYNRRGNEQSAIDKCIRAAERNLSRATYGNRAEVTQIRDVDRKRRGFEVKGRIAVEESRRGNRYGNYRNNGWDDGKFTCRVRQGRVVDIDYRGIRGV